jgi:hypothetical protein
MQFSLASLLVECCWAGILPSEKRQRSGWRSGRWHQQWPSRCFLFFLAQVSQYSIEGLPRFIGYDVLVLNAAITLTEPPQWPQRLGSYRQTQNRSWSQGGLKMVSIGK